MKWDVVYEKAIRDDGSLLFPERLTHEFLDQARRTMGSFLFANQYQNIVIPDDAKSFKRSWLKYFETLPDHCATFGFLDPAIGQDKHNDYTGVVVVSIDTDGNWYLRLASRYRLTPTQIVDKVFELTKEFGLSAIGIESVAYQEALLYLVQEEVDRRKILVPIKDVRRARISKNARILGLVPRFEFGRISIRRGLNDFEDEYISFPRAKHDDLFDALASIEEISFVPEKPKPQPIAEPRTAHDPSWHAWALQEAVKKAQMEEQEYGETGY